MSASEWIYECNDVWYSHLGRFPALGGIHLKISKGESLAIIGANGCGKSTLLAMMNGLFFPDRGMICFEGQEMTEALLEDDSYGVAFRKKVGLMFQNPDIQLFCPTIREDMAFGPLQLGWGVEEVKERVMDVAKMFQIEHLLDRSPHQISLGEKRKAALATVWMMNPEIILLDEPTAGLDPKTSSLVTDLLLEASADGRTLVVATHDWGLLEKMRGQACVFGGGRQIVKEGAIHEIIFDADLLAEHNIK